MGVCLQDPDAMRPTASGHQNLAPWQDMRAASTAAKEAAKANWPPGPTDYKDLFAWHTRNAGVLLDTCGDGDHAVHQQNLACFLARGVVHNDAYSGLGTASITLKQQMAEMHSFLAGMKGVGFGWGPGAWCCWLTPVTSTCSESC